MHSQAARQKWNKFISNNTDTDPRPTNLWSRSVVLRLHEPDVQLASVGLLDANVRSEAIEAVAPMILPLVPSGCIGASPRVLIISAREPKSDLP